MRRILPLLALLCLGSATPEELVAALELGPTGVTEMEITGDPGMFDVRLELGVIHPWLSPTMALMTTGMAANIEQLEDYDWPGSGGDTSAGDRATLSFQVATPTWARSVEVTWYFLSREYPEWVGSDYNDGFELEVDGDAWSGNAAVDEDGDPVTVNSHLFAVFDPADLVGTGFDQDGGTGWVTTRFPCAPDSSLELSFSVYDAADGVWDSAVLLDTVVFSEDEVEAPSSGSVDGDDDDDDSSAPLDEDFDDDGWFDSDDCGPANPDVHPGAEEICDGLDSDCDGLLPVDEQDSDLDSWPDCMDCQPDNGQAHPGVPEICDNLDTNCDGFPGPGEEDRDGDGYVVCEVDCDVFTACGPDCDDLDPLTHPGADERCDDAWDQDCDGGELTQAGDPDCWQQSCLARGAPETALALLALIVLAPLSLRRRRPWLLLLLVCALPVTALAEEPAKPPTAAEPAEPPTEPPTAEEPAEPPTAEEPVERPADLTLTRWPLDLCEVSALVDGAWQELLPGEELVGPPGELPVQVYSEHGLVELTLKLQAGATLVFDPLPHRAARVRVTGLLKGTRVQLWGGSQDASWERHAVTRKTTADPRTGLIHAADAVFDSVPPGPIGVRTEHRLLGQTLETFELEPGVLEVIELDPASNPRVHDLQIRYFEWRLDVDQGRRRYRGPATVALVGAGAAGIASSLLLVAARDHGLQAERARGQAAQELDRGDASGLLSWKEQHEAALLQERRFSAGATVGLGFAVTGLGVAVVFGAKDQAHLAAVGAWEDVLEELPPAP